jgi:hypothetical protein
MENTEKNFEAVFTDTLDKLEFDAKAAGSNLTEVCREAEISRTTPDRWRIKPPATVAIMAKLQRIVATKQAERAAPVVEQAVE